MNNLYFTLIILFSISNLLVFADIDPSSYSLLLGTIRKELVERALSSLPKKDFVDILQMCKTMEKSKEFFSLTDAESAYLVYKWISENIEVNRLGNSDYVATVYDRGEGSPAGVSQLFTLMCNYFKVKSKSISGFIKIKKRINFQNLISNINSTWNYILINDEYYLVDVTMGSSIFDGLYFNTYYSELFFATKPEIFINYHFPNDNQWQLLNKPYTLEKFESIPFISDQFYLMGFKTFSPEFLDINESGKIKFTLTYDESLGEIDIYTSFLNSYFSTTEVDTEINYSKGKVEIILNKNNEDLLYFIIECEPLDEDSYEDISILTYKLNP